MDTLRIRTEAPGDAPAIHEVERLAFGREAEAELVDAVREAGAGVLSLVGVWAGEVIGHVLFTPVSVGGGRGVALGPLAVHPDHQRQGVGTALVREGLRRLQTLGHGAVVVLGEPGYYRRFGFRPARAFGVSWDRPVPDEVFMALELRPQALAGGGIVRYHGLFDRL
ncbi:MAG: N-acetyltransferase [Myxococcota bacterium]